MNNNLQPSAPWSQRHPESYKNIDTPAYRSGWDHSYMPPARTTDPVSTAVSPPQQEQMPYSEQEVIIPEYYPANEIVDEALDPYNIENLTENDVSCDVSQFNVLPVTPYPGSITTESYYIAETTALESATQLLLNELCLLQVAGEITEVEAVELRDLVLQGDDRVKEALRQHSNGNSSLLILLLHRNDYGLDLLIRRDEQYATFLQQQSSESFYTQEITQSGSVQSMNIQSGSVQPMNYVYNPINQSINHQSVTTLISQQVTTQPSPSLFTATPRVKDTLPHLFYCDGDLCGLIMKRTQTKVFFKKWKHTIFIVKPHYLLLYATVEDWKQNRGVYWQLQLHGFITVSPILTKHNDETTIYTIELREKSHPIILLGSSYCEVIQSVKQKIEEYVIELQKVQYASKAM